MYEPLTLSRLVNPSRCVGSHRTSLKVTGDGLVPLLSGIIIFVIILLKCRHLWYITSALVMCKAHKRKDNSIPAQWKQVNKSRDPPHGT